MDIKTLILIGGGLLLIAVIGHGFWLAWRNRRNMLRLEIDPNIPQDDVDPLELLRGELPNGGARVRSADSTAQQGAFAFPDEPASVATSEHDAADAAAPSMRAAPRDRIRARSPSAPRTSAGRTAGAQPRTLTAHASDRITGARSSPTARPAPDPRLEPTAAEPAPAEPREPAPPPPDPSTRSTAGQAPPRESAPVQPERKAAPPEDVIVINVLARGGGQFHGLVLMEAFMRNKLKYCDMNSFHRVDARTRAPLFSIASAVEPGTFDLNAMDEFRTRGVCLFMPLPLNGTVQPLAAFEDMLTVARDIARSLGGDLKDEGHSVMTAQNIEHCRQRIADFTRKQLSRQ